MKEHNGLGVGAPDGIILTVAYAWPVNLRSQDGKILANTKWMGSQWNRVNNKPNRLFFDNKILTSEGGFQIAGDINFLAQAIAPLVFNGTGTALTLR